MDHSLVGIGAVDTYGRNRIELFGNEWWAHLPPVAKIMPTKVFVCCLLKNGNHQVDVSRIIEKYHLYIASEAKLRAGNRQTTMRMVGRRRPLTLFINILENGQLGVLLHTVVVVIIIL